MADEAPLNWNELANTKVGEVEPPKMIPAGHYVGVIAGAAKVENKGQKKTLCATFPIRLNEPLDDVDPEEFAASDGFHKNGYELNFWLTPNSLYRFTEFGKGMGASDDYSVPEMAEFLATCGEPLVVSVTHGTSAKNPTRTFMQIDDPIPLSVFNEQQGAA